MGVYGLTSYVIQRASDCFKDHKLHDCLVLIDGNSAASLVYSNLTQCNHAFGGDYDMYCHTIKNFIELLRKCDIRPVFIFDGGYELRKMKTILERIKMNVIVCGQYKHKYREGRTFPLLLRDIFRMVLQELDVLTIQCDFEADHEIVTLAKILKCPVISSDSDFYISNVQYIPFTKIDFKSVKFKKKSGKRRVYFLPCQVFDEDEFLNRLGGLNNKSLLPILSCALGNDYIPTNVFKDFLDMNYMSKFDDRIKTVVKWLKSVNSVDCAIEQLVATLKRDRNEIQKKIEQMVFEFNRTSTKLLTNIPRKLQSISDFILENDMSRLSIARSANCIAETSIISDTDSVNISIFTNNNEMEKTVYYEDENTVEHDGLIIIDEEEYEIPSETEGNEIPASVFVDGQELYYPILKLPSWLYKKFRFGLISPTVMNVHNFQKLFILSQSEDYFSKPSHEICFPVMQLMISIVLGNKPNLSVKCHARWKRMVVGVYTLTQVSKLPLYGALPDLSSVVNLSRNSRQKIILEGLKIPHTVNLDLFPEEWKLYIVTLAYWKEHCSQPFVNCSHVRTLFMCLIYLNLIDEKIGFVRTNGDLKSLRKNLLIECEKIEDVDANWTNIKSNSDSVYPTRFDNMAQILEIPTVKDCYQAAEVLLHYHHVDSNLLKDRKQFNLKIVHAFAQLQHCIQSIIVLNSVLDCPFEPLRPHRLFCGTFIYNLYQELHSKNFADGYVTKILLAKANSLISLYRYFMSSWEACFPTEEKCPSKMEKNIKRKKRISRGRTSNNRNRNEEEKSENIEKYNDPNNIFAALYLEE